MCIELTDEQLEGWDQRALYELLGSGIQSTLYVVGEGHRERGCDMEALDRSSNALTAAHKRLHKTHEELQDALEQLSVLQIQIVEYERSTPGVVEDNDDDHDGNRPLVAALVSLIMSQMRDQGIEIPAELIQHLQDLL